MAKKLMNSGFSDWTPTQLPDLTGKNYLVTGGNAGLGFETAKALHRSGANVMIGSRNAAKGAAAAAAISAERVNTVHLDLADLGSVRRAAESVQDQVDGLDAIVNNAGVMQTPQLETKDGFELQFGTNHLGHFLLNGLLYGLVRKRAGRIVPVSSIAHLSGQIHFDDLMLKDDYSPGRAYSQSKLANLMFGLELHRRLETAGSPVTSTSCHPGYAATNLQSTGPTGFLKQFYRLTNQLLAQPASKGAVSEVLSAAGTEAKPGAYYGPTSFGGSRGPVSDATVSEAATDTAAAARLWDVSEDLVGHSWSI